MGGVWRTIAGRRVFIQKGQSLSDAMKKSGKFKLEKNSNLGNSDLKEELTNEDKKVLDYYVEMAGAYDINYVLRNKDAIPTENDKNAIKQMDSALNKASLNKDIETYRYISDENVFYGMKKGDIYEDKGYMSTTFNKNTDRENDFQQYKIKAVIKAHKGDSALDVSKIYDKKTDMPESEIIFNRNTKLELKEIKMERDKYNEFDRKVYYFETKNQSQLSPTTKTKIAIKSTNTKTNYSSMTRKELATKLVEDQIKRGIVKPENKQRQILARLSGSSSMTKEQLLNYAQRYLK